MATGNQEFLPWSFEAFREYLPFEVMQPAAAVLAQYEGESFDIRNPAIVRMQEQIISRTGKTAWLPSRTGIEGLEYSTEGDLYRNKGRLLTSLFILEPKESSGGILAMLPFGRALGRGYITKQGYYDFILTRYSYPHPAYDDNWRAWTNAKRELYPFLYLLQILIYLLKAGPSEAYLTIGDVASHLFFDPSHDDIRQRTNSILDARRTKLIPTRERSDKVERKIGDIFGFLCLSGYCYYRQSGMRLRLIISEFIRKRRSSSNIREVAKIYLAESLT